ncbi:MAG: hypothetical protein JWO54_336 [Candidatus Saccharibacteria bacterium]|nr:hypothetical protein [Candidatus Saccharibacteria bacterium]
MINKQKVSVLFRETYHSFRKQLPGIIWGALFSGIVALIIWLFAYYGYTDLALPQRFEFDKFEKIVRKEIPQNFDYTTQSVVFRNSEYKSVLVIARDKNAFDMKYRVSSDIVLILDQTNNGYKVTYKFSPRTQHNPVDSMPLHAVFTEIDDLNNDGLKEIVTGWSYIGASYSPPQLIIYSSDHDGSLQVVGVPRLGNYTYPENYSDSILINTYDNKSINTEFVESFYVKHDEIAVINRNDDACRACGEDHIYNINYFHMGDTQLKEVKSPTVGIKGFTALRELLQSNGYYVKTYN